MTYIPLNQIVDALDELDARQKQILLGILQETTTTPPTTVEKTLTSMEEIRGARFHDGLNCPHCNVHGKFKKNGTYRGRHAVRLWYVESKIIDIRTEMKGTNERLDIIIQELQNKKIRLSSA